MSTATRTVKTSRRKPPAVSARERVPMTYRLTPSKVAAAKRVLGVSTNTAAIERALELVVSRSQPAGAESPWMAFAGVIEGQPEDSGSVDAVVYGRERP